MVWDITTTVRRIRGERRRRWLIGTTDLDGEVSQDRAKVAYAENYPRLQKVKKEWDPEMFFNRWFPIVPA